MIGYTMFGTNDMPKALAFYDALMPTLGAGRIFGGERFQVYGVGAPSFGICMPYNGEPATAGNGTMVALSADSQDLVRTVHEKALSLGAADEGAPGFRGGEASGFYAAYFRDPDGNKLCVFKVG